MTDTIGGDDPTESRSFGSVVRRNRTSDVIGQIPYTFRPLKNRIAWANATTPLSVIRRRTSIMYLCTSRCRVSLLRFDKHFKVDVRFLLPVVRYVADGVRSLHLPADQLPVHRYPPDVQRFALLGHTGRRCPQQHVRLGARHKLPGGAQDLAHLLLVRLAAPRNVAHLLGRVDEAGRDRAGMLRPAQVQLRALAGATLDGTGRQGPTVLVRYPFHAVQRVPPVELLLAGGARVPVVIVDVVEVDVPRRGRCKTNRLAVSHQSTTQGQGAGATGTEFLTIDDT